MAAMTAQEERGVKEYTHRRYKQKGSTTIYAGALVVCGSDGYAKPGTTATGLRVLGVAAYTSTMTSATDGATTDEGQTGVLVLTSTAENGKRRLFAFKNDTGTPVDIGDTGTDIYIKDDQTFTADSTGATAGGELIEIDADGWLWVKLYD